MTASVHCTLKGAWSLSEQLCSIFIFNLGRCPGFQVTSTVVNLNSIQRSLFTETPLSCLPQIHHLIVNYPLKNVQARPINLYSGFYNSYSCPRPYFFEITELYSTKNCREHWVSLHRITVVPREWPTVQGDGGVPSVPDHICSARGLWGLGPS